jgi:cysteine desulfurase
VTRRETYLDWNATAPPRLEAVAAAAEAFAIGGNPSSVHKRGRAARRLVEDSRAAIAAALGAMPESVIFTSGGTEANHLALRGCRRERVLVSAVEHASVLQAIPEAERIPVDADGLVDPAVLDELLRADARPALVSVMLANNETGVIQPIRALADVAHAHGTPLHCDAVQAFSKLSIATKDLCADFISVSAHKIGGPAGTGALIVAGDATHIAPLQRGGGQESNRRAGTENVAGVAGFAAAAAVSRPAEYERVRVLRDRLETALAEDALILGAAVSRLPNTTAIAMPGVAAATQVIALDLDGVMVSAGAACSSGKVGPSHVLAAMGVAPKIAESTIRVSLGWSTTDDEIGHFVDAWMALRRRTRTAIRAAA